MKTPDLPTLCGQVEELHAEIDAVAAALTARHKDGLSCKRGCSECCEDDLTVFEIEAWVIRTRFSALLRSAKPHPRGACAFLGDEGECRIYPSRPYVCRTQGLPLRWFEEDEAENIHELRDICHLNMVSPNLSELPGDDLWLIGPTEHRLIGLQDALDGGEGRRNSLRSLWAPPDMSDHRGSPDSTPEKGGP